MGRSVQCLPIALSRLRRGPPSGRTGPEPDGVGRWRQSPPLSSSTVTAAIALPLATSHAAPAGGWNIVNGPATADGGFDLGMGITCTNAQQCWSVGQDLVEINGGGVTVYPIAEEWDGNGWSFVSTPALPSPGGGGFFGTIVRDRLGLLGRRGVSVDRRHRHRSPGRALGRHHVVGRGNSQPGGRSRGRAPQRELRVDGGLLGRREHRPRTAVPGSATWSSTGTGQPGPWSPRPTPASPIRS